MEIKRNTLLLVLPFVVLLPKMFNICIAEVITLQSKSHLVCAVDRTESVIYVEPPTAEPSKNTTVLIQDNELWQHWLLENSSRLILGPVLDKRWEDFGTIYNNYNVFSSVSSLSFSIYSRSLNKIEFHLGQKYRYVRKPRSRSPWIHYTIFIKNRTAHFYEDGKLFSTAVSNNENLIIKSVYKTYWKIHNYTLRTASSVSQIPTVLDIPSNLPCLVLYASLHPHCILEVYKSNKLSYTFHGKENQKIEDIWESQKFIFHGVKNITLIRKVNNGKSSGFWALDIRKCAKIKKGKVIYEAILRQPGQERRRSCRTLSEQNQIQASVATTLNEIRQFKPNCSNAGELGLYCNLQCKDLLGSTNRYCEYYKICEYFLNYSGCLCGWGSQGPSCDQQCANGTWGLSCNNKCTQNYRMCDKRTGKCISRKISSSGIRLDCSPGKYSFYIHDDGSYFEIETFINNSVFFNITISRRTNNTYLFKNGKSDKTFPVDFNPIMISAYLEEDKLLEENFISPLTVIVVYT